MAVISILPPQPEEEASTVQYVTMSDPLPHPSTPLTRPTPATLPTRLTRWLAYSDLVYLLLTLFILLHSLCTPLLITTFSTLPPTPSEPSTPHTLTLSLFRLCIDDEPCTDLTHPSTISYPMLLAIRYCLILGLLCALSTLTTLALTRVRPHYRPWRAYYAFLASVALTFASVFTGCVLCWCIRLTLRDEWVRGGAVEVRRSTAFNVGGYCFLLGETMFILSLPFTQLVRWHQWRVEQRKAAQVVLAAVA